MPPAGEPTPYCWLARALPNCFEAPERALPIADQLMPELPAAVALGTHPTPATLLPVVPPIVARAMAPELEYPPADEAAGVEDAPPMSDNLPPRW